MPNLTPPIRARGTYQLKTPWVANPNIIYTCVAIRGFEDIYETGLDVYDTFYKPYGVTTGTVIGSVTFDFEVERSKKPNIITLLGADNSTIHVPDTFIASYPATANPRFVRIVLAAELPPLLENANLTAVKDGVRDYIAQHFGSIPTVMEWRAPVDIDPASVGATTLQEAADNLESIRLAAITELDTDRAKLVKAENDKLLMQAQIDKLTTILQQHGWLP